MRGAPFQLIVVPDSSAGFSAFSAAISASRLSTLARIAAISAASPSALSCAKAGAAGTSTLAANNAAAKLLIFIECNTSLLRPPRRRTSWLMPPLGGLGVRGTTVWGHYCSAWGLRQEEREGDAQRKAV